MSQLRKYFLLLCLALSSFLFADYPSVLYLTWVHDPSTTMMVHWHTEKGDATEGVYYRTKGSEEWLYQTGVCLTIPKTKVTVHTVELTQLQPDALYELRFGKQTESPYLFQTLPQDLKKEPVVFAVGGDVYSSATRFEKMGHEVALKNPRFAVLGGDIAYTHGSWFPFHGRSWQVARWQEFLSRWKETMRTQQGLLIPMIPVIGNHDVRPHALNPFSDNLLFYEIFFLPGNCSYRTLDCGSYLSLFLLDTGHSYHIKGAQTAWLQQNLSLREHRPYKLAIYHVGAYPSVYPMKEGKPQEIRELWSPLFEMYGVQAAFEHHNHAYKRTYPLRNGQIFPSGVTYIGDGSWGVRARFPKNKKDPCFVKAEKRSTVSLVTLEESGAHIQVISSSGKEVDAVDLPAGSSLVSSDSRFLQAN